MIRNVFLDFDGVVVESVDIKTRAFAKLFEAEGPAVMKKVVDYHVNNTGVSRYDKFRYIYSEILKRPLSEDEFRGLCDSFARLVLDAVVSVPYVKGAKEFLDNCASKYRLFIVSATPQKEIEEIVKRRGITKFFKGVYGAPNSKADSVKNILAEDGADPADSVYIGDALSDYAAAKSNGVNFIARINNNEEIFAGIDCPKVKDLDGIGLMIGSLR